MHSWNRVGALDRSLPEPLSRQLVRLVVDDIVKGRLRPGAPLPGTRTLATKLGVHRNTVVQAFDELRAQGWVDTVNASHTKVAPVLPAHAQPVRAPSRDAMGFDVYSLESSSTAFEAVGPGVLDFTGGLPDARLFRAAPLTRAYRRALERPLDNLLAFGAPTGETRLRTQLAHLLGDLRGMAVTAEDVLVTRGSQHALHLLSLALLRPNDTVVVESPGYPSARDTFRLAQARLLPIRVDCEGLDVAQLAKALKRQRVRAVLVTPQHQDPTTVTMSDARRRALLELARRHRFAVIETDYDYEFTYGVEPALPLASIDVHGLVVYVGTLTKLVAPGVRLGFVVAPKPLLSTLRALRGQVDRQGDLAVERAVAQLLADGDVRRHVFRARPLFERRRDVLVAALRDTFGSLLEFDVPDGGLALWARAANGIDVDRWARDALAAGARFFAGRHYSVSNRSTPYLRLGFAHLDEHELREAVRRLHAALLLQTGTPPIRQTGPRARRAGRAQRAP